VLTYVRTLRAPSWFVRCRYEPAKYPRAPIFFPSGFDAPRRSLGMAEIGTERWIEPRARTFIFNVNSWGWLAVMAFPAGANILTPSR